jgi:ParB-like chromosome segregation protein Spo0J
LHPHITHELVAGYRRMDAAEHSGLDVVPVIERVLTDVQAAEIALIENLQRKNPSEVDIGYSLTVLKEEMSAELDKWVSKVVPDPQKARPPQIAAKWEHVKRDYDAAPPWFLMVMERAAKTRRRPTINWADVGQRVGLSERSIQYLVKIAKLPPDVQEKIQEEKLSGRQAREIAQLDDALEQRKMASQAMRHGWSGDEIAKRVAVVAGRAPEAGSTPVAELRELMNRGNPSQTNADLQALCARLPELGISASTQAALQTEARRWREHIAATDSLLDEIERLLDEVR